MGELGPLRGKGLLAFSVLGSVRPRDRSKSILLLELVYTLWAGEPVSPGRIFWFPEVCTLIIFGLRLRCSPIRYSMILAFRAKEIAFRGMDLLYSMTVQRKFHWILEMRAISGVLQLKNRWLSEIHATKRDITCARVSKSLNTVHSCHGKARLNPNTVD